MNVVSYMRERAKSALPQGKGLQVSNVQKVGHVPVPVRLITRWKNSLVSNAIKGFLDDQFGSVINTFPTLSQIQ